VGASLYPPPAEAPTTTTTGLTVSSSWTINSFYASKINGVATFHAYLKFVDATSLTPTSNTENLTPEPTIATLPDGYRPPVTVNAAWGDGTVSGEAVILSTGEIQLRTTSYNQSVVTNRNLRITGTYTL
jgi:hypothetical protein